MSTRSKISIKIKKEDIGRTIKFDKRKLPCYLDGWGNEKSREKSKEVTLEKDYLSVYCHFDGYPSCVGAVLKERFNDYDTILNLLAGGSISYIEFDGVKHYANRIGEKWQYIKPTQNDEVEYSWTYDYGYVFEGGKWYVGYVEDDKINNLVELTDEVVDKGIPED